MPTLKPLPDCEGPKLECFTDDLLAHDFKFLTIIDMGVHSALVKAEIDGKIYAIKFGDSYKYKERYGWSDSLIETLVPYTTSFNNECRVFGRLKELGREDLAVRVHGYMPVYLNEQVEEQFKIVLDNCPFDGSPSGAQLLNHLNPEEPVMAIVKDYVPGEAPAHDESAWKEGEWLRPTKFPKMLRDLKELHRCGIVVRDLKYQQYINGTLVDFSHAWTIPHIWGPEQGLQPRWAFASMAAWDLYCFQCQVIGEWNLDATNPKNWQKPCRLVAYRGINGRSIRGLRWMEEKPSVYDHLRPRPGRQGPFLPLLNYEGAHMGMTQDPPYDPSLFDWRNVGKQARKNSKGAVTRKRKAAVQKSRQPKKVKPADEPKEKKGTKLTSKA
ncbi:hypothetical protein LCI18_006418 [Fusarium solani-melongenae]|uniref:Uncharacterized protein n=1 Tax=Fusarium solani subsp. cucurbitae TaxID=2747967 RepID=A0ACD3Z2I6_FUSSC|nr:hypothetical protein LCI18_006418 [Fusarium solani-melongenae]